MRGRLALALVSARAATCPQKQCGRRRHCQARFGKAGDNLNTKLGACPIMDEVEWRAVSLGIQAARMLLEPDYSAREEAEAAKRPKLSFEEEERRRRSPEAARERAEAKQRRLAHPGFPYWDLAWIEAHEGTLFLPRDPAEMQRQFLAFMAEEGCRCARERRMRAECREGCVNAAEPADAGRA
jgi:hypothetical protein